MKARLRTGIILRPEDFGGVVYVPHRDDMFMATKAVFSYLRGLGRRWTSVATDLQNDVRKLAHLGIVETAIPKVKEQSYSGPSFLGKFLDIPTVREPLVLNCFCTSHCPLACMYCHADDLMQRFRDKESDDSIDRVIATGRQVNSIVAVVTGGDPLTRPHRAKKLIEGLAGNKAVVLDSSGVGDLKSLLPTLLRYNVHVRISLDAVSEVNAKLRPVNRKYVSLGKQESGAQAIETITSCIKTGLPVTVQTVVTRFNDSFNELRDLRDFLVDLGVRNWVLHLVVLAGKAKRVESGAKGRLHGISEHPSFRFRLHDFIDECSDAKIPLDIRCTDGRERPNGVLLVGSEGDLFTESDSGQGKVPLCMAGNISETFMHSPYFSIGAHVQRYVNYHQWINKQLEEACLSVFSQ